MAAATAITGAVMMSADFADVICCLNFVYMMPTSSRLLSFHLWLSCSETKSLALSTEPATGQRV